MKAYQPPYTITNEILNQVAEISELISDVKYIDKNFSTFKLRKKNRIKSITGTLQIEGSSLSEENVTSVINGKPVLGSIREIEEVKGAVKAYESLDKFDYRNEEDLLLSHQILMETLLDGAGEYRYCGVGVGSHIAPPPARVPVLMADLFAWLNKTEDNFLIVSCIFHFEFEFIHPFVDGNGRVGRLWQTMILKSFKDFFAYIPIESMVRSHQQEYYQALEQAGKEGESTPFIVFMLKIITKTLKEYLEEGIKSNYKSNQKSDHKIYTLMLDDSKITIKEICKKLKMSESGVKKVIKKLKEEKRIERVGSLKSGYWQVVG